MDESAVKVSLLTVKKTPHMIYLTFCQFDCKLDVFYIGTKFLLLQLLKLSKREK